MYGTAWVRDNKSINETVLKRTLIGMTDREWYRALNRRVFFWLTEDRLDRLRYAPSYRSRRHDVLFVSTERLLSALGAEVELSPINSGAVHPAANYTRGPDTFLRIVDYPWDKRCTVARSEPIVELTVPYAVYDIAGLVDDVRTM
jgi:hypothetical protein